MTGRVGLFDSGVGGLSVWREIRRHHPQLDTFYIADQAHIPYGGRAKTQVLEYSRGITRFLLERGCQAVVVACNTASAVALQRLREEFPRHVFVGMEPAVKPAAERSKRKVVGVLGTPATLEGDLFRGTLERHASDTLVVPQACPGLVECIEAGVTTGPEVEELLRRFLRPPLEAGADVLVLACTHYPLVRRTIERLAGPGVQVIDPAPAIARQLGRSLGLGDSVRSAERFGTMPGEVQGGVVPGAELGGAQGGAEFFATTRDAGRFAALATTLLGRPVSAGALVWDDRATPALLQQAQAPATSKGAATAAPFQEDPPGLSS